MTFAPRRKEGEAAHLAVVSPHHLEESNRAANVIAIVEQGNLDGFAHGLEARKVDDSVEGGVGEDVLHRVLVLEVHLMEGDGLAAGATREAHGKWSSPPAHEQEMHTRLHSAPALHPVMDSTRRSAWSLALQRLSTTVTSKPALSSSTHVWLPMYPAPPVTRILFTGGTTLVVCMVQCARRAVPLASRRPGVPFEASTAVNQAWGTYSSRAFRPFGHDG